MKSIIKDNLKTICPFFEKIACRRSFSPQYKLPLMLFLILLVLAANSNGQQTPSNVVLNSSDVSETVLSFIIENQNEMANFFKKNMPPSQTNKKFRTEIINTQPAKYKEWRISDRELENKLKNAIAPVLNFYDRYESYEIFILNHPVAAIFIDTGVVLGVTTGFLLEVKNDDELLGHIAHEIGHEYFLQYSLQTKYLLEKLQANGESRAIAQKLYEILAIIEIQCDIFSGFTLKELGYNPISFVHCMERISSKFPKQKTGFHPAEALRREAIIKALNLKMKRKELDSLNRVTPEFADLQSYVRLNYPHAF